MAKQKPRKSNVEVPGLPNANLPPEAADMLELMQKAHADPDGLSETELAALSEMVRRAQAEEDAELSPADRAEAVAKGTRAWQMMQAGDLEAALALATSALVQNEREPTADVVSASLTLDGDQEMFEAMGAVATQVEFELARPANEPERVTVLQAVNRFALFHAGVAAFQALHFESAIGPLKELNDQHDPEDYGASLFLAAALLGDGQADAALTLIEESAEPHPVYLWTRVLALGECKRDAEAADALQQATREAPLTREYLDRAATDEEYQEALEFGDEDAVACHLLRALLQRRPQLKEFLSGPA